jgi:hypothetical protein
MAPALFGLYAASTPVQTAHPPHSQTRNGSCEVPVGSGVILVAVALPGCDFLDQGFPVRDAAVEALRGQDVSHLQIQSVQKSPAAFPPASCPGSIKTGGISYGARFPIPEREPT